jgi:hypothetical protein
MTHAYPRALRGPVVHDVVLVAAWIVVFSLQGVGGFRTFLLLAIPLVLAWGAATLHFPSRILVDDEGIAFSRHGRVHRFVWRDVARVRVRRFVVRDRVFVRLEPAPAWRGKYWILDSIDGFDALMATLETRATVH